jgi:hypothetical protein
MADLCRDAGVEFSLVFLTLPKRVHKMYATYAKQNHIDVIDCDHKIAPDEVVRGEVHPNGAVHRRWGDCIAAALAEPQRALSPSN